MYLGHGNNGGWLAQPGFNRVLFPDKRQRGPKEVVRRHPAGKLSTQSVNRCVQMIFREARDTIIENISLVRGKVFRNLDHTLHLSAVPIIGLKLISRTRE